LSGKPQGGSQGTGGLASGAPSSVAASPHPRRFQQERTGRGRERTREREGKREGGREGGREGKPLYLIASWISLQVPDEPGRATTMSEERMLMWFRDVSSVPVRGCMERGH
jgi:hypothetical protein